MRYLSKNKVTSALMIAAIISTLISGILQVFWILPIIKNWNKIWYYVGIGGTAILFAL